MAVWKRLPYEFFEVDAVEAWLDEQVSQGLSLQKIIGSFCRFERTSAGMTRYRVNILPTFDPPQNEKNRIEAYREMGWEYVTPLSRYAEIYRALSPDAAELNTDEEVLDDALRITLKYQLIRGIILAVVILLNFVINFFTIRRVGIYRYVLQNGIWIPISFVLEMLLLSLVVIFSVQPAIAVRKRELLSRDYHSPAVFARRRRRSRVVFALTAVMFVCLVLMTRDYKTYHMEPTDCHPLLTLEDFCPEAAKKATADAYGSKSSVEKSVSYQQLGPMMYFQDDDRRDFHEPVFRYDISDHTICRQALAANYARELTDGWDAVAIYGYDGAWYQTCDYEFLPEQYTNRQQLVLLKDNEVIEITYDVNDHLYAADLRNAIPLLAYK